MAHLDERAADLACRALGAGLAVRGAQVARVDRRQAVLGVPVCAPAQPFSFFAGVFGKRGSVGVRAAVGLRVGARGLAGDADLDAELPPKPGRSLGRAERPRAKDGARSAETMERERTLVRGQHVSSAAHLAVAPQTLAVGVRQCLASGQQYSVALHTVPDCGAEHTPVKPGRLQKEAGRLSAHVRVEGRRRRDSDGGRDGGDDEAQHIVEV